MTVAMVTPWRRAARAGHVTTSRPNGRCRRGRAPGVACTPERGMKQHRFSASAALLHLRSDRESTSCLPLTSVRVYSALGAHGADVEVAGKQALKF
jgi:hypothetical protein